MSPTFISSWKTLHQNYIIRQRVLHLSLRHYLLISYQNYEWWRIYQLLIHPYQWIIDKLRTYKGTHNFLVVFMNNDIRYNAFSFWLAFAHTLLICLPKVDLLSLRTPSNFFCSLLWISHRPAQTFSFQFTIR